MKGSNNKKGAVPILTVIFLGVVLSIIAIAFARLAVREQRQSGDDDVSTAANYAAETGTEDARRAIDEYLKGAITYAELQANDCDAASGNKSQINLELAAEYTCQLIDLAPEYLLAKPGLDGTYQFRVEPVADDGITPVPITRYVIEWSNTDLDGDRTPRAVGSTTNLPHSEWASNNYPAMLRLGFSAHNKNTITKNSLSEAGSHMAAFVNPLDSDAPSVALGLNTFDSKQLAGDCRNNNSDYICRIELTVDPANRFGAADWVKYIDVRTQYTADTVKLEAYNNNGKVSFKNGQAVIDVTGRSGDSYKRVQSYVDISRPGSGLIDIANYSLIAGDGICKNFEVTDDPSQFFGANPGIGATSCK